MALPIAELICAGHRIYDCDGKRFDVQSVLPSNGSRNGTAFATDTEGNERAFSFSQLIRDGLNTCRVARAGELKPETVEHPEYYGGPDDPYEVIKVAEAWGLDQDAYLFNLLKYIARAGKKNPATRAEDLRKGRFYLDRRINHPKDNT